MAGRLLGEESSLLLLRLMLRLMLLIVLQLLAYKLSIELPNYQIYHQKR